MYALLSLPFLLVVLLLDLVILRTRVVYTRPFWIILALMLALTVIFDQLLTGLPIVQYNEAMISGIRIWHAPIEDLAYTIAAVIGVGALTKHETKH